MSNVDERHIHAGSSRNSDKLWVGGTHAGITPLDGWGRRLYAIEFETIEEAEAAAELLQLECCRKRGCQIERLAEERVVEHVAECPHN